MNGRKVPRVFLLTRGASAGSAHIHIANIN